MKIQDSIKYKIAEIESTLIPWFRPSFLHITNPDDNEDILIIISTRIFINKPIHERIQLVMAKLHYEMPDIFKDRLIVIQAYAPSEMDDLLEYIFDDKPTESEVEI